MFPFFSARASSSFVSAFFSLLARLSLSLSTLLCYYHSLGLRRCWLVNRKERNESEKRDRRRKAKSSTSTRLISQHLPNRNWTKNTCRNDGVDWQKRLLLKEKKRESQELLLLTLQRKSELQRSARETSLDSTHCPVSLLPTLAQLMITLPALSYTDWALWAGRLARCRRRRELGSSCLLGNMSSEPSQSDTTNKPSGCLD